MSRIVKIIKGKKGYFIQREDAPIYYSKEFRQAMYKTSFISSKKLIAELKEQFEEGYPINASDEVLKELEKKLNAEFNKKKK